MADRFGGQADTVVAPATRAVAIAPSDTVDLTDLPKAIYVGTGGNIALVGLLDANIGTVFRNVPDGALIPFRARRVLATGTTAADLVALY